jgi:hypothetical protein
MHAQPHFEVTTSAGEAVLIEDEAAKTGSKVYAYSPL